MTIRRFYHFTSEAKVELIRKIGLQPQVPNPAHMTGGIPVVWLTAVPNMQWMGSVLAGKRDPSIRRLTVRVNTRSPRLVNYERWHGIRTEYAEGVPDPGIDQWYFHLGVIPASRIVEVVAPFEGAKPLTKKDREAAGKAASRISELYTIRRLIPIEESAARQDDQRDPGADRGVPLMPTELIDREERLRRLQATLPQGRLRRELYVALPHRADRSPLLRRVPDAVDLARARRAAGAQIT